MTEQQLAERLSRDLNQLALEANWSITATPTQPYGNYTDAIDDAKIAIGVTGNLADATAVQVKRVRLAALGFCYDRLANYYATLCDITVGPRKEELSQLLGAVERAKQATLGGIGKGFVITKGPLRDWTAGGGDER